jgi:hypothetical protein
VNIYKKIAASARKFEAVYPRELPARLAWWREALGIDPARLLRMLGMSPRQATRRKNDDLQEILANPEWEVNGRIVEEGLCRLLTIFHHDWHLLAAQLHGQGDRPQGEGPARITHRTAKGNGKIQGVPLSLSDVITYLTEP